MDGDESWGWDSPSAQRPERDRKSTRRSRDWTSLWLSHHRRNGKVQKWMSMEIGLILSICTQKHEQIIGIDKENVWRTRD